MLSNVYQFSKAQAYASNFFLQGTLQKIIAGQG